MGKGYDDLLKKVKRDCDEGQGCFNPEGCDFEFHKYRQAEGKEKEFGKTVCIHNSKCGHEYCDKFKWIIDRAKHYEKVTGISWEDILDSWQEDCNYWYMNYYQDCNQPLLEGKNVRVFDSTKELLESIGEYKFRCPSCGGVSTNPYKCNSGEFMDSKHKKVCDWKVYGLFGGLGKTTFVFVKDKAKGEDIFTPLAWEQTTEGDVNCD